MRTNPVGDSVPAPIDNDPYASVVIPATNAAIDDSGAYGYDTPQKPDFVRDDDENFTGA